MTVQYLVRDPARDMGGRALFLSKITGCFDARITDGGDTSDIAKFRTKTEAKLALARRNRFFRPHFVKLNLVRYVRVRG